MLTPIFFISLDAREMAHFLHMTRNCYYREGYEVESEPDTDDTDSYMVYSDSESEYGEAVLPRTVHNCDDMEVEGVSVGGDDVVAGMIPAEEEADDEEEVTRPPGTAC